MKNEIMVPRMGESISEAIIGVILKPSGSKVAVDDEILELETDKVNQVIYAPAEGVVQLTVNPQDVVKIGQVIGFIDSEGSAKAAAAPAKAEEKPQAAKAAPKTSGSPAREGEARKMKEQFIQELTSSPAEAPPQKQAPAFITKPVLEKPEERRETRKKMSRIRQVIAGRLVEAQHTAAMLTTFNEVDLSQVISLREKYKDNFLREYGVKLGFMPFFVKAVISALKEIPELNAYIDGDEIVYREYYDIGIAVGTDRGTIVPVVRNCDYLSFADIELVIDDFAAKARDGSVSVDDLQGGGFTITNGGVFGSLLSTPILNFPQSGILGMHKIVKRPIALDDQVVIRPMMYIALTYDHRIIDGKEAVLFLVNVKNSLEDPSRLLLGI